MSLSRPFYHPGEFDDVSATHPMVVIRKNASTIEKPDIPFIGLDHEESSQMRGILDDRFQYMSEDEAQSFVAMEAFVGDQVDDSDESGGNILKSFLSFIHAHSYKCSN